jgi:hypothetical protein
METATGWHFSVGRKSEMIRQRQELAPCPKAASLPGNLDIARVAAEASSRLCHASVRVILPSICSKPEGIAGFGAFWKRAISLRQEPVLPKKTGK